MRFDAIIFDFDGVLIESEHVHNVHLADYLTHLGHPTTVQEAVENFMGLSGAAFIQALEQWIAQPLPTDFHEAHAALDARALEEGLEEVAGAVGFILGLPPGLPRAIASSSRVSWIERHLEHLGVREHFGDMIFSGHQHVARGKPAPDIYLHAAQALGVDIARSVIIEDSPVGATGAVASGAQVIGLCAGSHCLPGHAERLRTIGVHRIAHDFDEVRDFLLRS
ncbi:HAD family hydrolase [Sphingosinicella terrae]|uniref:HAD family hydrolase n=1 Tax=Sphingosinicella terrae TaxID=2172047 RepID=UPI000E0CFF51|nr:HAD family phosphatase [Sphingosinicella terrae]